MYKKIVDLIRKNKKQFTTYTLVGAVVSVLNIFLMWLFIDVFGMNTIMSGVIVIGGLFILKFILYEKTGFTTTPKVSDETGCQKD